MGRVTGLEWVASGSPWVLGRLYAVKRILEASSLLHMEVISPLCPKEEAELDLLSSIGTK